MSMALPDGRRGGGSSPKKKGLFDDIFDAGADLGSQILSSAQQKPSPYLGGTSAPRSSSSSSSASTTYRPPVSKPAELKLEQRNMTKLTPFKMPVMEEVEKEQPKGQTAGRRGYAPRTDAPMSPGARGGPRPTYQDRDGKPAWLREPETTLVERLGKAKTRRSYQLTKEDYEALNPQQKAAIDFNTLLVNAREKDLNADYTPSDEQRKNYRTTVREMFGKGNGSKTYAPETMAVLSELDFKATGTEDLDDFLGLKGAVGMRDLSKFKIKREVPEVPLREDANKMHEQILGRKIYDSSQSQTAKQTAGMQAAMARASKLLADTRAVGDFRIGERARGFGAADESMLGMGPAEDGTVDKFFQNAIDALSRKDEFDPATQKQIREDLKRSLTQSGQGADFLRFADHITRGAAGAGKQQMKGFYTPDQIRAELGLDKLGAN